MQDDKKAETDGESFSQKAIKIATKTPHWWTMALNHTALSYFRGVDGATFRFPLLGVEDCKNKRKYSCSTFWLYIFRIRITLYMEFSFEI